MREVDRPSWRFAHDIDQSLHVVLSLHDALGLQIEDALIVPPRLAGGIPDHSESLDLAAARAAAARWPIWWSAVVALQAPAQLEQPSEQTDQRAWRRQHAARRRLAFDPPEWASLADSHALQRAARNLWIEGCAWFDSAREPFLPPACHDVFPWEQVREGAERAATEHAVEPGAVNGCAQVLMVEGSWWQLVAPGVALCSIAAARDFETVPIILANVFDTYLTS